MLYAAYNMLHIFFVFIGDLFEKVSEPAALITNLKIPFYLEIVKV